MTAELNIGDNVGHSAVGHQVQNMPCLNWLADECVGVQYVTGSCEPRCRVAADSTDDKHEPGCFRIVSGLRLTV